VRAPSSEVWQPPPRLLVVTSVVVLVVGAALAIIGALQTGVTTDEPIHVMRLRNYLDNGWYALDWDYSGAGPGSEGTNTFVYAPVTMLLLHGWCVLWGVEGWGEVATSPHAYDVRHLGVALIGLIGVGVVAATARAILGHWRWGIVAAASLMAVPMWTGHVMFNIKDVPVATGYSLVTLAMVLFLTEHPPSAWCRLTRTVCLIAGLILALGTRPGIWPGISAVVVLTLFGVLMGRSRQPNMMRTLLEMAASGGVAAGALVAIYPRLFGSPLRAIPRTTEASSSFLDGLKSNRYYVPLHVLEEMPTFLLAFALTGAAMGAVALRKQWRNPSAATAQIAAVGVQAFALPVMAVVVGADLYHGLRQLLFAAPATAILTASGMAWWLARPKPKHRWVSPLAITALALPVVDQVTLQPYQTTYANVMTDLVAGPVLGYTNRPGGDFWRASLPELIANQPLDRLLLCKATVGEESNLAYPFTNASEAYSTSRSLDCREEVNGPLFPRQLSTPQTTEGKQTAKDYDAVFLETLPHNCTPLNQVTRWRHGFDVTLTILARCSTSPPILDQEGVRADDVALGTAGTNDLWRFAVEGWQQLPGEAEFSSPVPRAAVAFDPGAACRTSGCALVIYGFAPTDLVAHVGGEQLPVRSRAHGKLTIQIPAQPISLEDERWIHVTLTRRSGKNLDMRMSALVLAPEGDAPKDRTTEGEQ
jgi:hypothetical protein